MRARGAHRERPLRSPATAPLRRRNAPRCGPSSAQAEPEAVTTPAGAAVPDELAGPHRLRIEMEETTDEPADRRRMRKVCAQLAAHPGDLLAELVIRTRDGASHRMQLAGIDISDDLIAQIHGLLGVLGRVGEVGDTAYAGPVAAAAAGA